VTEITEAIKAKGLISCGDQEFFFVAGNSGRWNFVGGAVEAGETPLQAFLREADEEIENLSQHLTTPTEAPPVEGQVADHSGRLVAARWLIFRARLLVPYTELVIPPRSEIKNKAAFTVPQIIAQPLVAAMAKKVILQEIGKNIQPAP